MLQGCCFYALGGLFLCFSVAKAMHYRFRKIDTNYTKT